MSLPITRIRSFPAATPDPGQVSIAVARHDVESLSPEAEAFAASYAEQRAQLVHELVDDTGVRVVSWGETDAADPKEVTQITIDIAGPAITALGAVLAAWIARPRRSEDAGGPVEPAPPTYTDALLPGFKIKRADGAELVYTFKDGERLPRETIVDTVTTFLTSAVR